MATNRGHRTNWLTEAASWAWWAEDTSLSDLEHNSDKLVVASQWRTGAFPQCDDRYRFAIKFHSTTAPSWASDGPIAPAGMALFIPLRNKAMINVADRMECAPITAAWDDTTNLAGMRALTVGTWQTGRLIWVNNGQGIAVYFGTQVLNSNGIMFRARHGDFGVIAQMANIFSTRTLPQMRYYYQYTPTQTTRSDATDRPALATETVDILNDDLSPERFETTITVLASERSPDDNDSELSVTTGLPALIQRKMDWPESWKLSTPSAGALPLDLVTDTTDGIRGRAVETVVSVLKRSGETVEIAKQIQIGGDTKWKNAATGEVALRSATEKVGNAAMVEVDPLADGSVNYDDEDPIYVLLDAVMNCGAWLYKRWHYNDIVYLMRRFQDVFSGVTLSTVDLSGKKVSDVLGWFGPMLGVCFAQSADGCLGLFHPGVYRESIRVHTIDEDDCAPGGCIITERGRDGMYGGVEITSEGGETSEVYQNEHIPSEEGWIENLYSLTALGTIFDEFYSGSGDFEVARRAAGTQLSQRMCGRYLQANLSLEKKGLIIDPGDQINLTCGAYSGTKTFLVTRGNSNPNGGINPVEAVHYPDYPGLHSTFQNTGVKGIWRWTNPNPIGGSPVEYEFDPLDWIASDPPFVTDTSLGYPFSAVLPAHYQGKCIGDIQFHNSQLISDTAGLCDLIDICAIIHGDFPYDYSNYSPTGWSVADNYDYVPIMWWTKASGTEAIMLAVDRSTRTSTSASSVLLNRLFIGYTPSFGPAAWSGRVNAPYGTMGGGQLKIAGSSDIEDAIRPVSIGVAWKDTTIRLYIDGLLMGELDDANFDKADWTTLYIRGCDGAPGGGVSNFTQFMVGCVRHIQTTGWIEESRIMGTNGIDPYYP